MPVIDGSIQLAYDTLARFTTWNGVLLSGQATVVSDAASDSVRIKIGDGVTVWTSLPYYNPASSSQTLAQTLGFGYNTGGNPIRANDGDPIYIGTDESRYIYYNSLSATPGLFLVNNNSSEFLNLRDAGGFDVNGTVVTMAELGYVAGATSNIQTQLNAKQATLVSATNIKTVGGVSLLGAGDLGSISTTYTDAKIKGAIAASNRIAFGSGVADTLTDSANITYNGTTFAISGYLSVAATSIPFYLNSTNSNVNKLQFKDNGTSRGYLGASSLYCFTAYESTGAVMRLGLTSAGNLLVGATSSSGTNVIGDFSRSATDIVQHRVTNASTSNGAYTQYTVYNTTANILNLGVVNTGTTTSGVYVQAGGYNMATGSGGYSIGTLNAAGVVRMYGGNGVLCFTVDSSSHFEMADGKNWKTNTSTGSKLCDSTSQKFAFWNKTPIVQPTTSITGAALTSNLGTPITSTDTFGGYTLQQLAAIIINTGLAA